MATKAKAIPPAESEHKFVRVDARDKDRFDRFCETFRLTAKAAVGVLLDLAEVTPNKQIADIVIREPATTGK